MSSQNEPLLFSSSFTPRRTSLPCRALLLTLSLAAVLSLVALFTLQPSSFHLHQQLHPSHLCTNSPNPSSCLTIVSDAFTRTPHPSKGTILNTTIHQSKLHLDATIATTHGIRGAANDGKQHAALADCLQLMDLSRDHLTAAASAASPTDSRTWLSAVLTNHVTCLDGLDGAARSAMEEPIKSLMSLASASLAVLSTDVEEEAVVKPIIDFPSWVSHRDRKLLQATTANAIASNVVVAQDGSGKFKSVQQAVDAAPANSKSRYVIYVKKGTYKETVRLDKSKTNIMIVGDGQDATVISGSLNNVDGATTFNSATLAAVGTGLILQDLKVENTAGAVKHQAVALRVGADQAVINRCRLDGYQDTLYTHSLRQFYRDCFISGTVDFIFGNAAVVFQNCNIVINKPLSNQKNTVTAQGRTDPNQNTGTSIQKCTVKAASDLAPVIKSIPSFLGRPWQLYSRTVFMQTYLDSVIDPKGWLEWDGDFALKTLYYGEYQNTGPGAGTAGRVKWPGYEAITSAQKASAFTVASLIQGGNWLQSTGVTYTEGL